MHDVCMLSERLQILVSPEQRQRLEGEARQKGASVGALVRDAIDARFGSTAAGERRRAVEEIAAMSGTYLPVEELEAILAEERERDVARRRTRR